MDATPVKWQRKAARRTVEGFREIGILLLAFAPLDYSLAESVSPWTLGGFVVAGISLFAAAVAWEVKANL